MTNKGCLEIRIQTKYKNIYYFSNALLPLEHECSICFVKWYSIPLVLMARIFIFIFKKDMAGTCMEMCPKRVTCPCFIDITSTLWPTTTA